MLEQKRPPKRIDNQRLAVGVKAETLLLDKAPVNHDQNQLLGQRLVEISTGTELVVAPANENGAGLKQPGGPELAPQSGQMIESETIESGGDQIPPLTKAESKTLINNIVDEHGQIQPQKIMRLVQAVNPATSDTRIKADLKNLVDEGAIKWLGVGSYAGVDYRGDYLSPQGEIKRAHQKQIMTTISQRKRLSRREIVVLIGTNGKSVSIKPSINI